MQGPARGSGQPLTSIRTGWWVNGLRGALQRTIWRRLVAKQLDMSHQCPVTAQKAQICLEAFQYNFGLLLLFLSLNKVYIRFLAIHLLTAHGSLRSSTIQAWMMKEGCRAWYSLTPAITRFGEVGGSGLLKAVQLPRVFWPKFTNQVYYRQ